MTDDIGPFYVHRSSDRLVHLSLDGRPYCGAPDRRRAWVEFVWWPDRRRKFGLCIRCAERSDKWAAGLLEVLALPAQTLLGPQTDFGFSEASARAAHARAVSRWVDVAERAIPAPQPEAEERGLGTSATGASPASGRGFLAPCNCATDLSESTTGEVSR